MINPKRLKEYLERADGCCNCHDHSIEGGSFEQDGLYVTQNVWCTTCGAEWTNVFRLVSIRDFKMEVTENEKDKN